MISLVVIAVITLILYPTISDLAPNNNEYLFKSAYKTIEMVTSDIMNTPNTTQMPLTTQQNFCNAFCEKLNTTTINPTAGNCSTCTNFTTSNGMRWAFAVSDPNGYILVDVNASNNNADGSWQNGTGFATDPWLTGTDADKGIFRTNDPVTQDTFEFKISPEGKISIVDSVGVTHMQSPGN